MAIIEVEITSDILETARRKANKLGALRNSITEGDGNLAGFIGEAIANSVINGELANTYDYDILGTDGVKYDVKTKRCTSAPKPHYECSVAAFNTKQACDVYVFTRVWFDISRRPRWRGGYILGYMEKQEFYRRARKLNRGDIDPSNNFVVKADCYNIKISDIKQFGEKK